MSDYRNPNDPLWRGAQYEPATSGNNVGWGWIAGALALVILVAIAFGVGHSPTETASNDVSPQANRMTPPPSAPRHVNPAAPGLTPPPAQQSPQAQ
jgi:hypothetical protein